MHIEALKRIRQEDDVCPPVFVEVAVICGPYRGSDQFFGRSETSIALVGNRRSG